MWLRLDNKYLNLNRIDMIQFNSRSEHYKNEKVKYRTHTKVLIGGEWFTLYLNDTEVESAKRAMALGNFI